MKKILLAFDGDNFCESSLEFALKIHEKTPVMLTAAFLPRIDYANLWSYADSVTAGSTYIPLLEDRESETVQENIKRFGTFCSDHRIPFKVHTAYVDFALPALKKEARYADLLILSSEEFYKQAGTALTNPYLKELLHDLECPVLIIPEKYRFPQSTILAFDGSVSSVYAIKQFVYLFPELLNNPTTIVFADKNEDEGWPDEENIRELIEAHFNQVNWTKLDVSPKKYFSTWLLENKDALLVSGSFGRSGLSMFLKKSFVTEAINNHALPVFIAHK